MKKLWIVALALFTMVSFAVDCGSTAAIVEVSDGSALAAGDISNAGMVMLRYDGTSWHQISQSGN